LRVGQVEILPKSVCAFGWRHRRILIYSMAGADQFELAQLEKQKAAKGLHTEATHHTNPNLYSE